MASLRFAIATWTCLLGVVHAAEPSLEERVVAILESQCLECHDGADAEGSLSLVSIASILAGGDSGPAVVAGKPDESLLMDFVAGDNPLMPKDGPTLSAAQVADLRQWIESGLPWKEGRELSPQATYDYNWWSLRPLGRPKIPAADSRWIRTPIDAFILAALREHGLEPSPEADRRTLIRRLYFDLVGLPPAPEEVAAFLADDRPDAYEYLVDALLASPHYGERWGRHWLDVAHYGDTHGYDKDKLRPNAWPYRDYVIRALNEDKPYTRFVEEQLAGDVLYPGTADGVIATGFLAAGPFDYVGHIELAEGSLAKAITRNLDRDDMVASAIGAFNSMTAHCARCHDHKFDPITQEDYYSLQAVFAGVDRADRPYGEAAGRPGGAVFAAATHFPAEGQFTCTEGRPRPVRLLQRGNEAAAGLLVGPGTCSYLPELPSRFDELDASDEGARRAALARWMVDQRNPLTWRSIVNRVWQYHFGRGIVDTPNDFGRMGSLPTHPQLLDWLAVEFREGPQSLKQLHRMICTSAVYRQSSAGRSEGELVDADNRYLWRMNRRRLEAEAVRDAVLAVAGKLDRTPGGPGFRAFGFEDDHSPRYKYEEHDPDDPASHRRSVYRFIVRSVPDPLLTTLDCADASAVVARRNETVTPLQSLALLNNSFMLRMAEHFSDRVASLGGDQRTQLTAAWRLALAREPTGDELRLLEEFAAAEGMARACRVILNMNEFVFID